VALAIETHELTRMYGARAAVDHLSLQIEEGKVFGFLGANGAGKSTTLKMLCGLLTPTSGWARVAGIDPVRDRTRLKQAMGFMPQAFGLYGYLTVRENLEFYGDLYVRTRKEARERIKWLLDVAGLGPRAGQRADALSAGWRQRLALGCAILHHPRVLFLDEPTAGVDPISRRLFWDLIHTLNEDGATIFVTTHYMEEVERCHQIGMMADGVLKVAGVPGALKAEAARRFDLLAVDCDQADAALACFHGVDGVRDAYIYGDRIHLAWDPGAGGLARSRELLQGRVQLRACVPRSPTMEDVFVQAGVTAHVARPNP
jgi:ABC-2 type transport system ATP-binding protein